MVLLVHGGLPYTSTSTTIFPHTNVPRGNGRASDTMYGKPSGFLVSCAEFSYLTYRVYHFMH